MKVNDLITKYKWLSTVFWIVVTAVITLFIEKSCDRLIPEEPVIVKEISDTIKIVHSYDFGVLDDSLINIQLQHKLKNIELLEKYEGEVLKQLKQDVQSNIIKLDASFPNAKGYSPKDATPYFSMNIPSLQKDFIEIEMSFIHDNVLKYIYCLSLKIFKVEDNKRIYLLDENYNVNGNHNLIRITNTLPKGTYEFCVGFVFEKDRNAVYPNIYQLSKIISK